jgi:hypothetical protein
MTARGPTRYVLEAFPSSGSRHDYVFLVAVPQRTLKDDVYKGVFIPKGAVVFANTWYVEFRTLVLVYCYSEDQSMKQGNSKRREDISECILFQPIPLLKEC